MYGQAQQNFSNNRGGAPNMSFGGSRGGFGGVRGGNTGGGRGRGPIVGMNRGGNRGRGGGSYNNMGSRGGGSNQGGSFRGHGSSRGFGNRDNRRGGSFGSGGGQGFGHNGGGYHHQHHFQHQQNYSSSSSLRGGRNQGFSHSRGSRHEGGGSHITRDGSSAASTSFSSGKKDENRRTLTDFKIIGLEIAELKWSWGHLPHNNSNVTVEHEDRPAISETAADVPVSGEVSVAVKSETVTTEADMSHSDSAAADATSIEAIDVKDEPALTPPPSRIRIYFHTPVSADDLQPLTSQSSFTDDGTSNIRKGKRKKLEDDDGDFEDGRGAPPPPPHLSAMRSDQDTASVAASVDFEGTETAAGRDSVAPSVTETASEGDWLMAAIGEEDADGEDVEEHLHGPEVETYDDPNVGHDGEHHDHGEYGKPTFLRRSSCPLRSEAPLCAFFTPLIHFLFLFL